MSTKVKIAIISVVLYLASFGLSFLVFSLFSGSKVDIVAAPPPEIGEDGKVVFDDSLPKTESCPLNGQKFSKQQREWWEKHRPLGVMIENHEEARPQSGISSSDVVYEAVAEGGITRFLVVFYCQDAGTVGPVRSARTYFLDFISEYGDYPLYAHVGGANTPGPADALGQIGTYGWNAYNDINQFSVGFPTFWRDYDRLGRNVATEHTMYSATQKLWEYAEKERGLTFENEEGDKWNEDFVEYSFVDDPAADERGDEQSISLSHWEGTPKYLVDWTYDKTTNEYKRENGGEAHTDLNNEKQLTAKNIVILFMRESSANDGYEGNLHLLYGTKGSGQAIVFKDGEETKATWSKSARTGRTLLKDSSGKQIEFTRGRIWFHILPTGTEVDVN